ncbi:hypothetical protein HHK36_030282 [Tetracentron sinense]|uniref:FH2 domain-containing protein n=1 Tax=Tetracentron sinense TaxID=13715 RepID=A0A835CY40_TETSI|nr:hypothetical protein HHK36_030282 [Tetracentron sinense]
MDSTGGAVLIDRVDSWVGFDVQDESASSRCFVIKYILTSLLSVGVGRDPGLVEIASANAPSIALFPHFEWLIAPMLTSESAVLALDMLALDIDQVENLIKFCPTKEEMEMLKVKELRSNLNTINDASREVKESVKLRQIMQTILTLGDALNQGMARGSAIGFKLDSLLKLSDTRARNNNMTLMHYLCKAFKNFLDTAEAEVRSLISLYSEVGINADSLSQYFGEDPARCPFEQVTSILVIFVKMFNKSRAENAKQADAEKKKLEKEAMKEQANSSARKESADVDRSKLISQNQKHVL